MVGRSLLAHECPKELILRLVGFVLCLLKLMLIMALAYGVEDQVCVSLQPIKACVMGLVVENEEFEGSLEWLIRSRAETANKAVITG